MHHPSHCTRRSALVALASAACPGAAWAAPGGPVAPPARAAPAAPEAPAIRVTPLLAAVCPEDVDPAPYLVSEKFDGVRALWDGVVLRHRSGRVVPAPRSFLAALPGCALDGELWLGRGRFDRLSAIVRSASASPDAWAGVRYLVFELPGAGATFAERAARIAELTRTTGVSPVQAVAQERVTDRAALRRRLDQVVAAGGEGLMLHLASAAEAHGRSDVLLKLKPQLDAEATVLGYRPGTGKYAGLVGALTVRTSDGVRFLLGTGLSDALRRSPPPIGSVVTFRYRDRTPGGVPRFASYLRRHEPF